MKNEKLRKALDNYGEQMDQTYLLFDNPAYDNSIVGIARDGCIVYDYQKMVEEYASDCNCSLEEAEDFLNYNLSFSIPDGIVIIESGIENLIDFYGE